MGVILEVKDLVVRFYTQEGTVYAVNGVSYDLEEGETLGIVGESGSGKSVSSLALMGLIPARPEKLNRARSTLRAEICCSSSPIKCG